MGEPGVVIVKLAVIVAFLAFGVWHINSANWTPFLPPNTGKFGEYGFSGILRGAGVIFFAYIGFDAVSTAAQEAKHPQRDMPIGIIGSLAICTLLYIAVAMVLTGIVPTQVAGYLSSSASHSEIDALASKGRLYLR